MTTVSLRSTFYLHLISLFLFLPLTCTAAQMPPAMGGGKPGQIPAQLSPADMKMLEQMEQEINSFVNTLPPEEQKKFWTDVDDLTKVMNNMSEEELLKFMEDVFKEEAPQAPAPIAPVALTPAPEIPKAVIEKPKDVELAKPITLSKKQEDAIKMIDSLIVKINNFLKKAQIVPDIASKITTWIKKGKLSGLKATTSWASLKSQIEELEKNLNKLKDRDPKTTKYKYIDALIADEALYNNMTKLENSLAKFEPKIDVPSLGLGKLNRHSRESLRSVIASLNEAITLLDIPAGLEKVFATYEATAQSIKQSEEASVKKALTNKPVSPVPSRVGGRGDRGGAERFGGPEYPDFGPGGYGYPDMSYAQPQHRGGGERVGGQEPTPGKGTGGKAPSATGAAKPEEKKKEEEKAADDKNMDGYINTLSQHFESTIQAIEDNKKLANIERHIIDSDRPYDATVSKDINAACDALTNAAKSLRLIKRRLKTLKPAQKTKYIKLVKDTFKDYEKDLNKIGGQVVSIKNRFNDLQSKISPEKQAGYFGIVAPNAPDSISKLASGRTLYDIQEKIAEIKEELAAIEQTK